jgi:DNA-binding XRE family transcriptional regulator
MTTGTKKPKWGVVNFKQIEARRKELSLPKSTMASNLGITNSTYHNWARGATVPHESQQEQIKAALDTMTGAPAKEGGAGAKSGVRAARESSERTGKARETVAGGSIPMPSGFTPTDQSLHHFTDASVRGNEVNGIATITAAYIAAQGGAVTKEVVFDFISGLQRALNPVATSAVVSPSAKVEESAPVATG